ncbi:MAG: PAS domain-containing sensor histidine kinase [Holophagales bacterium]|nr:PAS domain-containing sensor histidine kinase [Holophagales bacterium]
MKPGSTAFGETGAIEESQKRTLERLREAEQRWQFALEGSGDGVWDWNPATGETYFSPRFKELLGYGKDELDASVEAWNSRMHPEDGEKFSLHLDRHLEGVTPGYEVEHRLLCRDGTYRWFETRGLVLERDAEGRPSRVIGTARDVTARREAEERLRLSHDRLQAANLELARAARMKDEFLASMSHELRTPLGAVLGMATLLKEQVHGPLPPESLRQVEVIRTSGEHLLGLLNDVLDVARIDAGRLEARLAPCFLSEVGEACLRRIGRAAAEKGLEVALVVDPPGLVVETDGPLLSKLLGGLLSNAVKFTPSGGRIGLELTRDEAAGVARIVVRDTGIGISPENLGKLFETFTQLDGRTERLYGGTGLGLALVRRLARLLGGTISVQSELDRGTRFLLTLPCRPGGSEAEAEAGPLPVPGAPSTPGSFDPRPAAGADLSGRLPEGLRSALGSAIRQADLEQVDELTRKLVEEDPETARFVLRLARDFEYERLLALLGTPGGFGPGQDPSKAED